MNGWDNPGGRWHWYSGGGPICGSDAPLSLAEKRTAELPGKGTGKKCRRCLKEVGKKGRPHLMVVEAPAP